MSVHERINEGDNGGITVYIIFYGRSFYEIWR